MHKKQNRIKDLMPPVITFILIIFIWQSLDKYLKIKEIILPSPSEIISSLIANFSSLIYHAHVTFLEAFIGFIIAVLFSFILALVFVHIPTIKKALYPYAIIIQATPILAIAPLLVLWFGNDMSSKIIMSALMAFFPVLVGAVKGLSSIEEEQIELFRTLSASKFQIFLKLRFPNSLSYIFPALKVSATFAIVGATVAEFTGASRGIGHLIVMSSYHLDTSLMFASIVVISLVGIIFFYSIVWLEKKVMFW